MLAIWICLTFHYDFFHEYLWRFNCTESEELMRSCCSKSFQKQLNLSLVLCLDLCSIILWKGRNGSGLPSTGCWNKSPGLESCAVCFIFLLLPNSPDSPRISFIFIFIFFTWSIVDLQSFRYTAKWSSYTYICKYIFFSDSFPS